MKSLLRAPAQYPILSFSLQTRHKIPQYLSHFRCCSINPKAMTSEATTAAAVESKEVKLWGGRFEEPVTDAVEKFSESISFDKALYKHDIMGSRVHASILAHQGPSTCSI